MIIKGDIYKCQDGMLYIIAPFEDDWILRKRQIKECEIRLDDGRRISASQRMKTYALLRDIALSTGYYPEEMKAVMKYEFISKKGCEYFSLSNCDMTMARNFISFLIEFCIRYSIPTRESLLKMCPDTGEYIYACLVHKKCCITGRKAELHHVDAIGMGRDRNTIIHKGMRVLPLCTQKHEEYHKLGGKTFCDKYKVFGIELDNELCQIWKVKG